MFQIADGLRQSAINLIENTPVGEGGTNVIFAEADFYPMVNSWDLERVVKSAPDDWDVLELFKNNKSHTEEPKSTPYSIANEAKVEWHRITSEFNDFVGTHALMFRNRRIATRFAEAIKGDSLPIDNLLEKLNRTDRLIVYRPTHINFFVPWNPDELNLRDRRFLVGMMSYRRIKDACRQIYTFMDQSYTNFVMHVLLKGVDEYDWKERLCPSFRHFINEGRLIVDVVPNDNQIANLLQLPNGIPEESYDLITKVDDDDWYDRDYMKRLNDTHRSLPVDVSSSRTWLGGSFHCESGFPVFYGSRISSFGGSTMVFTKELLDIMRGYVESDYSRDYLLNCVTREDMKDGVQDNYKWREDNLQFMLSNNLGVVDRTYIEECPLGVCVTRSGMSMTRDGYIGSQRKTNYKALTYDHVITLTTSPKRFRIFGDNIFAMKHPDIDVGNILDKGEDYYIVRWKKDNKLEALRRMIDGRWSPEPVKTAHE